MDDRVPSGVSGDFRIAPDAKLGRRYERPELPGHLLLHEGVSGAGKVMG